ncbi:16S rRNA (cytosine(1402)-N(4))-methyltransferase RsmH [Orientia tsutsugamushi]|uniref:16S rRNA (cytosine(1402)-N(4))-methyltransferase RsmH n=1 Tax=Orientia tsutsugamushi TaxID=784 RepID=UPI001238C177|nr:16S rRNA (cytosine(1402)-N(4))-methyltransferase RsmH [Orientia tsutsugamushi]QES96549.1 16S rRNA (cytosine(1402)-N(4))-methyltransferase RsmH [Orientia tsutsugamushi]
MNNIHTPVLATEMLSYLAPVDNETYLDCTFGAGGYSKLILSNCNCKVIAFDRDPAVISIADRFYQQYPNRFTFFNENFVEANKYLSKLDKLNGIVMDLGVSSMQLDEANRGFSFRYDAELDMRMSQKGYKASEFVNEASEHQLADIIYKFGEENKANKIAKHIVLAREKKTITTTLQLANIIREAVGYNNYYKKNKIDSATKTFQAIRIFINDELSAIQNFLNQSLELLAVNGRLIVVSFHALEDAIVKKFMHQNAVKKVAQSKYSTNKQSPLQNGVLHLLTKKIAVPTRTEIINNPRSRSARLRAALKINE